MTDAPPPPQQQGQIIPEGLMPDWTHRRQIIYASLWFCAAMAAVIILTFSGIAIVELFVKATIDPNVVALLSSCLYTIAFVATSIIGSYVFGMNLDWANTRQHIVQFISANAGLTAAIITRPTARRTPSAK